MVEGVVIAPAGPDDVDAVHRIEVESFPAPWRREFFASELDAHGRFTLVARRGDAVIGYLFAIQVLDEMHVNKIAVTARERRKGIADALMAACVEFAAAQGVEVLSLEVRRSNRGAQDFYRRLGFAATRVRRRYYPDGEDALVMETGLEAARLQLRTT